MRVSRTSSSVASGAPNRMLSSSERVEEEALLRHEDDPVPQRAEPDPPQVDAVDGDLAAGRVHQPGEQLGQRRLAGAGLADDRDPGPRGDAQRRCRGARARRPGRRTTRRRTRTVIGPRGSSTPSSPGSATSAGVSMMPMTRRQPATAFCISLRISVACWTGIVKRLTRKRKASSSPRVSGPFTASRVPTTRTTAVVRPDTSWPVVKAMTARVCARTAERRWRLDRRVDPLGGAVLDAVGADGRRADDRLGDRARACRRPARAPPCRRGRRCPGTGG